MYNFLCILLHKLILRKINKKPIKSSRDKLYCTLMQSLNKNISAWELGSSYSDNFFICKKTEQSSEKLKIILEDFSFLQRRIIKNTYYRNRDSYIAEKKQKEKEKSINDLVFKLENPNYPFITGEFYKKLFYSPCYTFYTMDDDGQIKGEKELSVKEYIVFLDVKTSPKTHKKELIVLLGDQKGFLKKSTGWTSVDIDSNDFERVEQ